MAGYDAGGLVNQQYLVTSQIIQSLTANVGSLQGTLQALVTAASQVANVTFNNPNQAAIPTGVPYASLLTFGSTGMTPDVEAAIWQRGIERAKQMLNDRLDAVKRQWGEFGAPLPDGTLATMLLYEMDKFDQEYLDLNRQATETSYRVAADFARTIVQTAIEWQMAVVNAQITQNRNDAEVSIKQGEVLLQNFVERLRINVESLRDVAQFQSQVASSAFTSVSTSAHIADSVSHQSGTRTTTISGAQDEVNPVTGNTVTLSTNQSTRETDAP